MISKEKLIKVIWYSIDCPEECGECPQLQEIPDQFLVGDSPSAWNCIIESGEKCPKVQELIKELDDE